MELTAKVRFGREVWLIRTLNFGGGGGGGVDDLPTRMGQERLEFHPICMCIPSKDSRNCLVSKWLLWFNQCMCKSLNIFRRMNC